MLAPNKALPHVAACISMGRLAVFSDNKTKVRGPQPTPLSHPPSSTVGLPMCLRQSLEELFPVQKRYQQYLSHLIQSGGINRPTAGQAAA